MILNYMEFLLIAFKNEIFKCQDLLISFFNIC